MSSKEEERVEFVVAEISVEDIADKNHKTLHNSVVVVPVQFLVFDGQSNNRLYVRYMQAPHNDEDVQLISSLTARNDTLPPEDWPLFNAKIIMDCSM